MAERMRFELTVAFTTPPFQDGALNRSANAPKLLYSSHFYNFTDFKAIVNLFLYISYQEPIRIVFIQSIMKFHLYMFLQFLILANFYNQKN